MRRCPCGGEIPPYSLRQRQYWCRRCRAARNRVYDARYRQSGAHNRAQARYRATAKGRATLAREVARRIRVHGRHVGYADTPARADLIRAHITQRRAAFRDTQRKESPC